MQHCGRLRAAARSVGLHCNHRRNPPKTLPALVRPCPRQVPGRLQVLRRDVPPAEPRFDSWPRLSDAGSDRPWRPELVLVPAAAALLLMAGSSMPGGQPAALTTALPPIAEARRQHVEPAIRPQQHKQQRLWESKISTPGAAPAVSEEALHGPAAGASPGASRPFVLDIGTASALVLSMAVAALANSAGVGGGAFIVPLMYLGLGFDIKDSTALSQAVIAGGALGSVACTVSQHHPLDSRKPLIDYRLALIITPPLLLGCTTGVLFNQLLPSWGVTFLLIPLLCYLTYRTACTAARLHAAEAALATLDRWMSPEEEEQLEAAHARLQREAEEERGRLLKPEPPQGCPPPWLHGLQLLLLWGVVLGFQLGKQSFDRCTWQFGMLYGGQAAATLAASAFFIWQVLDEREKGCGCGSEPIAVADLQPGSQGQVFHPASGDSSAWAAERLLSCGGVALAGGTVAGMLGIGGGMVVGPLLLELGVHPQVSAATASAMVLFSASSAAASFSLDGRLNSAYAAAFGVSCAMAAYLGVELVGRAVRASGKSSLVVMLLAGIIGTGALLTLIFSGGDAVAELLSGRAPGLGSFCGTAP